MKQKILQLITAFIISFIISMPVITAFELSSPVATVIDDTSASINWTTTEPATSKVIYGKTSPSAVSPEDKNLVENHSITLTGLISDSDYVYEIASKNESEDEIKNNNGGSYYTFKTLETVNIEGIKIIPVSETEENVFYKINWTTNIPTDGKVVYGNVSNNLTESVAGASSSALHTVEIKLKKGELNYYQVQSSYKKSSVSSVRVPFDITPPDVNKDSFDEEIKKLIDNGYTNNKTFLLKGTVEANAIITPYHNLARLAAIEASEIGEFETLMTVNDGINRYKVEVKDEYENKASFDFNITADVTEPFILLRNFEESTIAETTILNMSISEESKISILLNDKVIYEGTDYVTELFQEINLVEDGNNITITAVDKGGNQGKLETVIGMQGPPKVLIIDPIPDEETNLVPVTVKEHILKGMTSPGATVLVYEKINDAQFQEPTKPIANVTADEKGYFEAKIELASADFDFSSVFQESDSARYVGGTKDEIKAYFTSHNETKVTVSVEAIDVYGRKSEEKATITYLSTSCGVPGRFTVSVLPDRHNFKPYRLRDGTEMLNIDLDLTWRGYSPDYKVVDVRIVPQQKFQKYKNSENFECFMEGEVFKNAQLVNKISNENQTFYRFTYKLNAWKGMNDSKVGSFQEAWKALVNKNCKIPIEIHVRYQTTSLISRVTPLGEVIPAGEWMPQEEMVHCHETSNLIQESLDQSKVLPEWFMDGSIAVINQTHEFLKIVSPWVKGTHQVLSGVCLGYIAKYFYKHAATNAKCTVEMGIYNKDKDEAHLQACADAIEEEKQTYNHYRMVCDRVLCKTAPVNPQKNSKAENQGKDNAILKGIDTKFVGSKDSPDKCLPLNKYSCGTGSVTNPQDLINAGCVEPSNKGTRVEQLTKNASNALIFQTEDCKSEPGGPSRFCCLRASYNEGTVKTIEYLKGTSSSSPVWKSDPNPSTEGQYFVGEPWNYGQFAGYTAETVQGLKTNAATWFSTKNDIAKITRDTIKKPETIYYVEGLHGPTCFNQGSVVLGSKRAFFEPTQNFRSAIQCGCVSQINGYVQHWERLTGEMMRCLEEAKVGDTFSAAACEKLFTQFVCDLFTFVMVEFVMEQIDNSFSKNEIDQTEHGWGEGFLSGMKGASTMFTEDYKESFAGTFDLGVSSLSHSVCMAAFTGEWGGLFEGAFGFGDKTPPRQTDVFITTASAELISSNPLTGAATTEYGMGIWLQPGSNLMNYKVELVCDYEGDCPAVTETLPFITADGTFPGIKVDIKQDARTETPAGHMRVDNQFLRYNKIRVCWTSAAGPQFSATPQQGNCVTRNIGGWSVAQFGCALEPTKALSGNQIFSCPKYVSDTYAEFAQFPPKEWTMDVIESSQRFTIPFKIKAEYAQIMMEQKPFLIQYKQIAGENPISQGINEIPEGYTDENDYGLHFTVKESDFKSGGVDEVTIQSLTDNKGVCQIQSETGTVTKGGSFDVKWIGNAKLQKNMFSGWGTNLNVVTPIPAEGIGSKGTDGNFNATVQLTFYGKTISLRLTNGSHCQITNVLKGPTGPDKITKKFLISLHNSRAGDPRTPDQVIVRRGNTKQEQEVTVTLTNKITGIPQIQKTTSDATVTLSKTQNLMPGDEISITASSVIKTIKAIEVELQDKDGLAIDFAASPFNGKSVTLTYRLSSEMIKIQGAKSIKVTVTDNESNKKIEVVPITVGERQEENTPSNTVPPTQNQ